MKKLFIFIPIISIFFNIAPILSQEKSPNKALSLEDCIQMALKNRPEMEIATLDIQNAEQQIKEVNSNYFPRVNVNLGYTRFHKPLTFDVDLDVSAITEPANILLEQSGITLPPVIHQNIEVGKKNWYSVTLDLNQPVYTFGRIKEGVKQARIGHSIAKTQKDKKQLEVITEVKKAYYQFLFIKELVRLLMEAEVKANVVAKMTKIDYETSIPDKEGKGTTRIDYLQARNFHSEIKVKLIDSDNNLELAELVLKRAIGLNTDLPLNLEEPPLESIQMTMFNLKEIKGIAQEKNIDLKNLNLGIRLYESKQKLAKKEYLPKIGIQGQYVWPEDRLGNPNVWYVGIALTMPLFDGFSTKAKVAQAEIQSQKVRSQKILLENALSIQIENLNKTLIGLMDKMKVLRAAVKEAQERTNLTADGYAAGITEYEKLLYAQKTEIEMKSAYLQNLYLYHITKSEIEFVLGL